MKVFSNWKIGVKLAAAFGMVLTLTIILGITSIRELTKINGNTLEMADNWLPSVETLGKLSVDANSFRRFRLVSLFAADGKIKNDNNALLSKVTSQIQTDEKAYEPMISSDEERGLYNDFRAAWDRYLKIEDQVNQLIESNKGDAVRQLSLAEGRDASLQAFSKLSDDIALNQKGGDAATKHAAETYASAYYWTIGLIVGTVLASLVVAFTFARYITGTTSSDPAPLIPHEIEYDFGAEKGGQYVEEQAYRG